MSQQPSEWAMEKANEVLGVIIATTTDESNLKGLVIPAIEQVRVIAVALDSARGPVGARGEAGEALGRLRVFVREAWERGAVPVGKTADDLDTLSRALTPAPDVENLIAAAKAEAWDEGQASGLEIAQRVSRWGWGLAQAEPNPYRAAPPTSGAGRDTGGR